MNLTSSLNDLWTKKNCKIAKQVELEQQLLETDNLVLETDNLALETDNTMLISAQ